MKILAIAVKTINIFHHPMTPKMFFNGTTHTGEVMLFNPSEIKNRFYAKPLKLSLYTLKELLTMYLCNFRVLECYIMPKTAPKFTKVGPKNTKNGLLM